MGLGLTEDQKDLAAAIADWASATGTAALTKGSETAGSKTFEPVWDGLVRLGVPGIAVPEGAGGAGGTLLDLAVAVEACAQAMVPGPLLSTAAASVVLDDEQLLAGIASGAVRVALGVGSSDIEMTDARASGECRVVWGLGGCTHLLLPTSGSEWLIVPADDRVRAAESEPLDLATRVGTVTLEGFELAEGQVLPLSAGTVRDVAVTLAAAESAGIARWCLETAVAYAKVREQFGRRIGSFQAVKHLCAEMLEASESATAVAWDAAVAFDDGPEQLAIAAAAAGAVALDAAVATAQDAIQVLGGIGFTWEHDAHLYLRRAMSNRMALGGTDAWRLRLADLALGGVRRSPRIDLGSRAEQLRGEVTALARSIGELPEESRRAALVEAGLVMPHWPPPYGRGAGPAEQLVIDEELRRAGIARPDIGIGAWAAPTILEHGDDAQRERFLRPTLRGEITWCQLFSEPGAGSDLASLRTRAARTDGGWLLTGQKVWTSMAAQADWGICLARTDPDVPPHKGITYFLVDMGSDGIDIRPLRELTGDALFNEVFLEDVFVPDECVVGEVGGGWPLARTTLANERVAMTDRAFGGSVERALRTLAARAPAAEHDRIRVGTAVAASATAKALGLRGTMRSLSGQGPGPESSVLKLVGVRDRQESAELVLDLLRDDVLLGTNEGPAAVHEALVTRCLSIAGGTTQVLRNVAAERILGMPRS
jgi:alkylation response protein AidB-like acyl-CoA dehydrogenase